MHLTTPNEDINFFSLIATSKWGTEFGFCYPNTKNFPYCAGQFLVLKLMTGFANQALNENF